VQNPADAECLSKAYRIIETQLAALTQPVKTGPSAEEKCLRETLEWAEQNLQEINPSNYDHKDVCFLNATSVEVALGIKAALSANGEDTPQAANDNGKGRQVV